MRASPSLLTGCLLGLCLVGTAQSAELRAMRLWSGPDYTRAVFDISEPLDYKLFGLEGPDRLVLDVKNGRLAKQFASVEAAGIVRGVRTGAVDKQNLRVVLDLEAGTKPRSFLLPPNDKHGHRLVIDLHPLSAPAKPKTVASVVATNKGGERDVIVAIDAGHGGEDPGARGASGSWEKHLTLKMARELAAMVNAEPGMTAVLVRDGDYFIPLKDRYIKAREAQADLFVSVHADAFHKPTPSGASVFMLSQRGATSEAARWLANSENSSDLVGGVSLDDKDNTLAAVLLDLAQSASLKASADVANSVLAGLKRVGKTHKQQIERANFVVLRSPDVPSILVETGFISNPGDEKKLNDADYRRRLSAAILDGVREYFHTQPPPGTWIAANIDARPREHVVSRGETLSQIAVRHGVPLASLRAANRINGDVVRVGDRLQIPGMGPG